MIYRTHRRTFLARLAEIGAAALIPTATAKIRNHDCEYRFRPGSDFWYLTGFAEPQAVLLLLPARDGSKTAHRSVLFLRERDRSKEIWTGLRLGVDAAPQALGVDEAQPIERLWEALPDLLAGYPRLLYRTGEDEDRDRRLFACLGTLRAKARGGVEPPVELLDPLPILHEQRLVKTEAELARMRRAAEITAEAHRAAMAATRAGMHEYEIEALIEGTFRRRGSTGPAYNTIVAGGANACILHYVQNDQPLRDGDLLLVDAGCEWEYYASDVTRTWPVNGTFSAEQRAIYELVLEAQRAAMEAVRPGAPFAAYHEAALGTIVDGLLELDLLSGSREQVLEQKAYERFFMHKTGHWLGLDVHDCGAYAREGVPRPLEPGMVLTVEPGVYIAADDETVEPRWRGIGVRIEDDLLVTESGHEVLTESIPRTIEEVEAACAAGREAAGTTR